MSTENQAPNQAQAPTVLPKIKITVTMPELMQQFQQAAADEDLPESVRALAAKQCILVAHMMRIEGIAARSIRALGDRVTALEKMLKAAPAAPAKSAPAAPKAPAAAPSEPTEPVEDEGENEAEAADQEAVNNFLAGNDVPEPTEAQAPVIPINKEMA